MKKTHFLILSALAFYCILFVCILPLGHDFDFHIYRIGAMAAELKMHPLQLPIRMLSVSYNGYGYGAALFYGDLFLYPPAILTALGLSPLLSYQLFMVFIWLSTFIVAYYSVKSVAAHEEQAFFFATFYTFSATCLENLCARSAIGESLAFIFLPLVFASFYTLIYQEKKNSWLWLAVGMTAISMSHLLSLLLVCISLFLLCLCFLRKILQKKLYLPLLKATALTLALGASFLFPMLEQMQFQELQTPIADAFSLQQFMNHSLQWMDYLLSYDIKLLLNRFFSLGWETEFWHPGAIGLFPIVLCTVVLLYRRFLSKKFIFLFTSACGLLLSISITPFMEVVKNHLYVLQFPWRILPLLTLMFAACGAMLLPIIQNKYVKQLLFISPILISLWSIGLRYADQLYINRTGYSYVTMTHQDSTRPYSCNNADTLYLPADTPYDYYLTRGDIIVSNTPTLISSFRRLPEGLQLSLLPHPHTEVTIELPLYCYKGYEAHYENSSVKLSLSESFNHLVSVTIPYSNTTQAVLISYKGTLCQKISDIITFLTIMGLLFFWIYRHKKGSK